jgi:ADP-ribosylglycohydrolase
LLGAIAGDIIGSVFESRPIKTTDFPLFSPRSRFTDDTVLTVAVAYSIINHVDYSTSLKTFGRKYPDAGYGMSFYDWIFSHESRPYNSWGNGSAMRVSPIGFACNTVDEVLREAKRSAEITHNHPEGVKGAQATALAVFLAKEGRDKGEIRQEVSNRLGYDLNRSLDEIRPHYSFDVSCQGSVPESIIAFLESEDFEDAIRNGISLGGDSDTIACIAGGIAHAFYKYIPEEIVSKVRERLPDEFLSILDRFNSKYHLKR